MATVYPMPSHPNVTLRMSRNHRRDTKPELRLRRLLHASGARYRVDFRIKADEVTVRPDIVFTRRRLAIFLDGCFWHGCPEHGNVPAHNRTYWMPKLARNRARDEEVTAALTNAGWTVIRAWEHEPTRHIAERVLALLHDAPRTAE
jgi:DNA mismatch endonuclease (patch repair protein)